MKIKGRERERERERECGRNNQRRKKKRKLGSQTLHFSSAVDLDYVTLEPKSSGARYASIGC
jgi:hypothetical protein